MNIGYIFDENYVMCASVSIFSLIWNNRDSDDINFFIFDGGIHDSSKKNLEKMITDYGYKINFISVNKVIQYLHKCNVQPWRGSYTAYIKLLISRLLPDCIERFIVIDGDTIIDGSIKELESMDLHGHPCAMGLEGIHSDYKKYSGIGNSEHFNTGVIVYDLPVWKQKNIEEKLILHLKHVFGKYMLPEEDPISIILKNDSEVLKPEYNYLTQFKIFDTKKYFKRFKWDKDIKFYSFSDIETAAKNVKIFHCIDTFTNRPWDIDNCHPFSEKYDFYFKKIYPSDSSKKQLSLNMLSMIEFKLRKQLPPRVSIYMYYVAAKIVYTKKAKKYYKKNKKHETVQYLTGGKNEIFKE